MTLLYKLIDFIELYLRNSTTSIGLTLEILIQIVLAKRLQNFMEIDQELTEKSAKNTQRWWKLTAITVVKPANKTD